MIAGRAAGGALLLALLSIPAAALAASPETGAACFADDALLWLEVRADTELLAETMDAYAMPDGVYLPVGQFSRVLDLPVAISADGRSAKGVIGDLTQTLIIDLDQGVARIGNKSIAMPPGSGCPYRGDLFVRSDIVEQLLPVRLDVQASAQSLRIEPTAVLPFMQAKAVSLRRASLASGSAVGSTQMVDDPYRVFSAPAFDVTTGYRLGNMASDTARWATMRVAGDLLYAGFRGYLSTDFAGRSDLRLTLERASADNDALGPLGGRQVALGDIYTPNAPLGARSTAGRGFFYSTAPLQQFDFAMPVVLEGEMGPGEQAEVYVDGVLRAGQGASGDGRYRFDTLALSPGDHRVRLVFYGPQGQVREEIRQIHLGTGRLEPGQTTVQLGVMQPQRALIGLESFAPLAQSGDLRMTMIIDHGVTSDLTMQAGIMRYAPWQGQSRIAASAGAKSMLAGAALDAVLALDSRGGRAASLLAAKRIGELSVRARHVEYGGGFIDELLDPGASDKGTLRRASDLQLQVSAPLPGGQRIPVSFDLRRTEGVDGNTALEANARAAAMLGRAYLNLMVSHQSWSGFSPASRQVAVAEASMPILPTAQMRAGVSYRISPKGNVENAYVSTQWNTRTGDYQLGLSRFGEGRAQRTRIEAAHRFRLARFDIATMASRELNTADWRASVQVSFALAPDPLRRRYAFAPPGSAASGRAQVHAFADANGDGRWQPGEDQVAGVVIRTPSGDVITDANGRTTAERLGDLITMDLRVDTTQSSEIYLANAPGLLRLTPRQGRITPIEIALPVAAEVEVPLLLQTPEGPQPFAALAMELASESNGDPIRTKTDHQGVAIFDGVPPGAYTVRIAMGGPAGLRFAKSGTIRIVVASRGGFVRIEPIYLIRALETS